ncbi:hypothetical protein [Coxiella burnetii]|uniref:hypothetical protein n=1 Tax=Coxiella burnetii TaxID=777 RepID=UPI0022303277|nr:hypothetical protein [Coxiella burnetii]
MYPFIFFIVLSFIFFAARLIPLYSYRLQGCDAYYFLLCSEKFRKTKKLPIVLEPYYLLEPAEQWYPPLFSIFFASLPEKIVNQYHWIINHTLDYFTLVLLFLITKKLTNLELAIIVGLIYSFFGPVLLEFKSLTSRSLTIPIFILFLCSDYLWISGYNIGLVSSILFCLILIFSHKLTMQLIWFITLFLSASYLTLDWVLPVIAAYCIGLLFFRNMLIKIIKAHLDIVKFWYKNWPLLGAHSIYQSRVYSKDKKNEDSHYKSLTFSEIMVQCKHIFHINYWIIFLAIGMWNFNSINPLQHFLMFFLIGIYILVFLVTFLPFLRCFGMGIQYIKYSYPVNLLFVALMINQNPSVLLYILAFICILLSMLNYYSATKNLQLKLKSNNTVIGITKEMHSIVSLINQLDQPRIYCLPYHLADFVAYHTRKQVLWGTHGYGFSKIGHLFPVLTKPIIDVIKQHSITHLLIDKRYCHPNVLNLTDVEKAYEDDNYLFLNL